MVREEKSSTISIQTQTGKTSIKKNTLEFLSAVLFSRDIHIPSL